MDSAGTRAQDDELVDDPRQTIERMSSFMRWSEDHG